jgi:excisionase family DNA binding protein
MVRVPIAGKSGFAIEAATPRAYSRLSMVFILPPARRDLRIGLGKAAQRNDSVPTRVPMNVRDAAKRLEVSTSMVYALCAEGRLPHVRVGLARGTIRISEEDLRIFLERCRTDQPTPSKGQPKRIIL